MMAARPFKSLFRGTGRNALDLPVAGLAALAAAFGAFAVPQDLLSRAVVATGLPSILSAAQPPLGLTARVVIALGSAAVVFGMVFLLLRLLDRSGMNAAAAKEEEDFLAPRVRRRDGHPDAPAPRPISAARDLGEPVPPRAPGAPVPLWLDKTEPVAAPIVAPEPEPAPKPAVQIWPEPEPVATPEPEVAEAPAPEPVAEPAPEPVMEAEFEPEPPPAPEPEITTAPESAPQAEMPTSIAALMERLEQGLSKRRTVETAPTIPATPPLVFPEAPAPAEPADDRLQSAISSLQRLAARSS
jgi:outer membrane biosynthesis protein TonB